MRYSEVKSIASCWIITSSLIFLLLLSILHWYTDSESNRCILTRMMDIPMFEKIHVDCQHKCYIDYGLYRYQEGSRFRFRPYNMPVLFVTGSQGSFRTVRSLASTMLSFVRDNSPFDYYTVDLNEEVSAVSGEIIERQTEFVDKAIDTILRMYTKRPNSSKHVVLIGHSVGSVVIFNLLSSRWSLNQTKVKLVFSLASPIRQPIILSDRILAHIYQRMHNYLNRISKIPNYPLVILSITGGSRDKLVPDLFGNLDQDYPGLNSLSISSSAIQHVWASCDHRCILWCLQLMLVLNKCLLEHQSLSDSPKLRLNGFRDLLITKPLMTNAYSDGRANSFEESILKTSHSVASQMLWIDKTYQINTVMRFHVPLTGQLVKLGPFFQDVKQSVLLLVTNAPEDWLHLCIKTDDDNGKHCDYFIPIESSTYLTWLPDPLTRRSMAAGMITLSTLKSLPLLNHHSLGYDSKIYLVVSTGSNPSRNSMTIFLETFNKDNERRIHSNLPDYSTLQSFIYPNWLITLKPQLSGVFHRFYLPQEKYYLSSSTLTPKLLIKRRNCSLDKRFMGMITMNTLWCNYFHYVAIEDEETEISLQLPVSYPWLSNYSQESSSFVDLYLDPNCVYEVSVYYSLVSWFSQLIRLHWTHFGGLLCGHLLLSLMLVTVKLIKINENNTLLCYRRSLPVHEVYCHLSVVCIHFISFQLIHLPFSEWIELQQYGQLGLRLMTTLQLSVIHQSYLELILAHLPFFIISIPWAFLIPIGNYLLDGFLLFIAQIIQRISSGKQNDNITSSISSTSTCMMIISTLFILFVGWIISESLAVLLLSVLLLIDNYSFCRQNCINVKEVESFNYCQTSNIQSTDMLLYTKEFHRKNYIMLFYLLKCRIFILLIILSSFMLDDWISLIERVKQFDFSLSGILLHHYTSIIRLNHLISSSLILLRILIWLLQFDMVHIQSLSWLSSSSSSVVLFNNNMNFSNNIIVYNYYNNMKIYHLLIFSCKLLALCLLLSIFNLAISLYRIVQFSVLSLECISLILWFSCKSISNYYQDVNKLKKLI